MSPVVSSEDGKIPVKLILGKSVKVACKSNQISLMLNTDCRERQNLYFVIDIGCIFNKIAKKYLSTLEPKCITINSFKHHA